MQDVIPTKFSEFKILIPSLFGFAIQVKAFDEVEQTRSEVPQQIANDYGRVNYTAAQRTYIIRNVLALRDEPFMSSAKDYLQRIIFQLSSINYGDGSSYKFNNSWYTVKKYLLADDEFGAIINDSSAHIPALDEALKGVTGDYNKMVCIYKFIQHTIDWDHKEEIFGTSLHSLLEKKSGSNGEMNLCLISLLKNAHIPAYPLLVSTRDNGEVYKDYPFFKQFNNAMACVFINDKNMCLMRQINIIRPGLFLPM